MKKVFFALCVLFACKGEAQKTVLAPAEFQRTVSETQGAIVLDVRTPEEIATGRIANAQSIVYDDGFDQKLGTLENKPIFIYCASGKRSAKAAKILRDRGYKNVYELEGGLNAWKASGLPVSNANP